MRIRFGFGGMKRVVWGDGGNFGFMIDFLSVGLGFVVGGF